MLKKALNLFISILLLLPLFAGGNGISIWINNDVPSFQKICHMDNCTPRMPKCPLCPSSSTIVQFFGLEAGLYLPAPISSFILVGVDTLSDQGVIRAVFRPPALIS